jgi:hypothetical protein
MQEKTVQGKGAGTAIVKNAVRACRDEKNRLPTVLCFYSCDPIPNKKTSKLDIFSTENRLRLKIYSLCLTLPFMGKDVTR